ncbi:MAG: hypothetical protein AMXMBFR56_53440 [Polyangiaceae bacterium]
MSRKSTAGKDRHNRDTKTNGRNPAKTPTSDGYSLEAVRDTLRAGLRREPTDQDMIGGLDAIILGQYERIAKLNQQIAYLEANQADGVK